MLNFNEFITKVIAIKNSYTNNDKDDLKAMFQSFDKLEEDLQNHKARVRDKAQKDKNAVTTLQSIHEDDRESPKVPEDSSAQSSDSKERLSSDSSERRRSQKRSKHEVEGMDSPEVEKRQKRNASVKAQSIISKQVNVNLTQKLRRETSLEKGRRRRGKEDDKENLVPLPVVRVKQEKISIPSESEPEPEPMDVLSPEATAPASVAVKQEANQDDIAMPPPAVPKPKSRKALQKEKSAESTDDEEPARRTSQRSRRTRKQTDTLPAQTAPSRRGTRASSRATKQLDSDEPPPPPADTRPKRTRAKKAAETANSDAEKETTAPVENGTASPAEKPRPKRTRRAQKAAEKEAEKLPEPSQTESEPDIISPKEERITNPDIQSPVIPVSKQKPNTDKTKLQEAKQNSQDKETNNVPNKNVTKNLNNNYDSIDTEKILQKTKIPKSVNKNHEDTNNMNGEDKIVENKKDLEVDNKKTKNKNNQEIKDLNAKNIINSNLKKMNSNLEEMNSNLKEMNSNLRETVCEDVTDNMELDKTRVLAKMDATVTISKDLDQTMILPNGVFNHDPITPTAVRAMNETVVLDKPTRAMDATVVLHRLDAKATNVTDDNSLITDDSDTVETDTPPKKPPVAQPTSAVKEKVQQFEEMAARVTRTKTRAMAKKEEQPDAAEQTPPDKVSKAVLSSETLTKMNSMIFNGKPPQVSKSASKPRAVTPSTKSSQICASASKLSGINKAREAEEAREDARKKKEALLEAKREAQRRKREEKMAAAAAAREAAERERRAAMEAAVRERMEKQAHADQGKLERLREAERKKLETARKVAETEERRKAEEQARQQRLADEQRRAEDARRKQLEEAANGKKEAALMQKEIERRQKEFMERQRMKQRMEGDKMTPHAGSPHVVEPAYMLDGFQYLNSDEDEDESAPDMPVPAWSLSKARRVMLCVQARIPVAQVDKLFSVREHTPDLRDIFPNIERARLKRTSSAVWRTPPARLPALRE